MLELTHSEIPQLPREIILRDGLTFGRSPTFVDIQLSDPAAPQLLSRSHAVVYQKNNRWEIQDTKSLNGIFINGKQQLKCALKDRDVICFGGENSRIAYRFVVFSTSTSSTLSSECITSPMLLTQSSDLLMLSATEEDIEEYGVFEDKKYPLSFPAYDDVLPPLTFHSNSVAEAKEEAGEANQEVVHSSSSSSSSLAPLVPSVRELGNIQDKYELKEILGRGSYGIVRLAVRKEDNAQFAVKIINQFRICSTKLSRIRDEAGIMRQIDHSNCIKLYEVYERGNHLYLVMELATGGELLERRIENELEVAALVRSLASALSYLHSHGIVHRDLKPRNIMYASKPPSTEIKIADFGLALHLHGDGWINDFCGTPQYASPEVFEKQPYTHSCDMWSLGVVLYLLLCGFLPFHAKDKQRLVANITQCRLEFPSPYWDHVSDSAKNLVSNLLCLEPTKRLTAAQVLQHCFITGEASPLVFPTTNSIGLQTHVGITALRRTVRVVAFLVRVARRVVERSPNKSEGSTAIVVQEDTSKKQKSAIQYKPSARKKKIQFR